MYYKAALFTNTNGYAINDKEKAVNIPMPTGTGLWDLKAYKDQFGEETGNKYLVLHGNGYFSNSATTGSKLSVILFADNTEFSFRLIEYGSHVVKDDETCTMNIKDSEGKIYSGWYLYNTESGQMTLYSYRKEFNELKEILNKGGEIVISASMGKYTKSTYRFKMNVTGFEEAMKFIN